MGMELKWLLFLPVYRYAYIGMLANAYAKEQELGGVDYSVYEVVLSTATLVSGFVSCLYPSTLASVAFSLSGVIWAFLRFLEHFTIFSLMSKHPIWAALFSWIPGVLLWQSIRAWSKLNSSEV